ncbi:MAG: hypothetical protein KTR21_14100 [Rhodobacteraceae bacterium]|nr:hypothetical protein [Paracoccaceae bacterium]
MIKMKAGACGVAKTLLGWAAALMIGGGAFSAQAQTLTIVDETGSAPVVREMTREQIEALGVAAISTGTSWTDGVSEFSGPSAAAVAGLADKPFKEVLAVALNDYQVVLPAEDFDADAFVLATRRDGTPMRVRDRGPFWVVYNFDELSTAERSEVESRSIWQLSRLVFR